MRTVQRVILPQVTKKHGDPGREFLIPSIYGDYYMQRIGQILVRALTQALSVWKNLALPELTPNLPNVRLADRSITEPIGIAKDVRLMVGKFQFPADFVVVDFEPDPRVPLILGRYSFLAQKMIQRSSEVDQLIKDPRVDNPASMRLENPHQDKLENKEINEAFPLETLGSVALQDQSDNTFVYILGKSFRNLKKLCHSGPTGGHYGANYTARKVFDSGFYWPTIYKDTMKDFVTRCDICQHQGKITQRDEMATKLHPKFAKSFDICGMIYKWRAVPVFKREQYNTPSAVDYLSKWVEAKALPTNDARVVCKFLKTLFSRFGATPSYHKLVISRKVQLNELNELRDQAYENSLIYKEKTKRIHDAKIKNRVFNVGDRVLLFNSRLKIFSGKLKSLGRDPYNHCQFFPSGNVEYLRTPGQL
ncbi:reverse transcriptase domain-containing protein [Tanacetum coccineum]